MVIGPQLEIRTDDVKKDPCECVSLLESNDDGFCITKWRPRYIYTNIYNHVVVLTL